MKRNLLLIFAIVVLFLLGMNSFKRIMSLRGTSEKVREEEQQLGELRRENEALKRELVYKKSQRFVESEIRNKLGMAKEGEEVFVVPGDEVSDEVEFSKRQLPNWKKWQILIFGEG